MNRIRTIVNFREPSHSSPVSFVLNSQTRAALGRVMFCPQLNIPWLRECVRDNLISFPKAFSGFSFFRGSPKNMILWLFTYLLGLTFYLYGIISRIFHYFILTKGKLFKKITFFFLIFVWFIWRRWTEVEKGKESYMWSLHSMEINHGNIPFSHSTTTHCYILIKAFTGKGLFSLNIFFSSSENWKIKHFLSQVGTRLVLALLKESSKDFCN